MLYNLDPTSNVVAFLANALPGDTLHFASGVYNLPRVVIRDGISLSGEAGAIINGPIADFIATIAGNNINISGLTFVAGSIFDFGNSTRTNVNIAKCTFNVTGCGILITHGITKSNFTWNIFNLAGAALGIKNWVEAPPESSKQNPASYNALRPRSWLQWTVTDNEFVGSETYSGQCEGIHIRADTAAPPGPDNGPGYSSGLVFARNRMRGISRCGLEYQGGGSGSIIEDNIFEKPTLSHIRAVNDGSMGLSCAADAAVGMIIRRNKVDGTGSKAMDGVGVRNGIEGTGHGTLITDNLVIECDAAIDLNNSHDGASIVHNKLINNGNGNRAIAIQTAVGQAVNITDDGPDVALTWDSNRPWPINSTEIVRGTTMPNSPEGTTGNLVISSGDTFTLLNGVVSVNGVIDKKTHDVLSLSIYSGSCYELNKTGDWYRYDGPGKWTLVPSPVPVIVVNDPPPPPPPVPTILIGYSLDNGMTWVKTGTVVLPAS